MKSGTCFILCKWEKINTQSFITHIYPVMCLPSQPHLACCLSSPLLLLYIIGTNISEYVYSFQCFLAFLIVEFPLWTYYIKQRSHKNTINCTLLNLSTWCTPKSLIDMDCMPVDTHFFFSCWPRLLFAQTMWVFSCTTSFNTVDLPVLCFHSLNTVGVISPRSICILLLLREVNHAYWLLGISLWELCILLFTDTKAFWVLVCCMHSNVFSLCRWRHHCLSGDFYFNHN